MEESIAKAIGSEPNERVFASLVRWKKSVSLFVVLTLFARGRHVTLGRKSKVVVDVKAEPAAPVVQAVPLDQKMKSLLEG
jgi:hypothetical protein